MNAPFQLVITNKYNEEWDHIPVNFLDHPTLRKVFKLFQSTCGKDARILYSHLKNDSAPGETDNRMDYDLKDAAGNTDWDLVRNQTHVETIQDVQTANPELSSNEIKLRVMTRAKCFLSVQGGASVPTFFYGGTNIMLRYEGRESKTFYHKGARKFSGQHVIMTAFFDSFLKMFKKFMLPNGCAACSMRKSENEGVEI
jgi:hypothetical protein